MKRNLLYISLILILAFASAGIGGYLSFRFSSQFFLTSYWSSQAYITRLHYRALEDLRAGNTSNVIETLESEISMQMLAFNTISPDEAAAAIDDIKKVQAIAKDYDTKYGTTLNQALKAQPPAAGTPQSGAK